MQISLKKFAHMYLIPHAPYVGQDRVNRKTNGTSDYLQGVYIYIYFFKNMIYWLVGEKI